MAESSIYKYLRTGSIGRSTWCSVVLFGKNTSSYKLAPRSSSCSLRSRARLRHARRARRPVFGTHPRHAKTAARQSINRSNKFLGACPGFNAGTITLDEPTLVTVQSSFRYALDTFHVVDASQVPMTFFEKDFTRGSKHLILADNLFDLANSPVASNIAQETESHWNLVNTAWKQDASVILLHKLEEGYGLVPSERGGLDKAAYADRETSF